MKFEILRHKKNIGAIARKIGYFILSIDPQGETNLVRQISNTSYPRFHIYFREDQERKMFIGDLHLDQKHPVYKGSRAHQGEYQGPLVEGEILRIKEILEKTE